MLLDKAAHQLGFTLIEFKVILVLAVAFAAGIVIKYFPGSSAPLPRYDYAVQDSIFMNSAADTQNSSGLLFFRSENKLPAYKSEALDLREKKFEKKVLPGEHSININQADIKELIRLPGIGEKTARKILDLRESRGGRFSTAEDLLAVKGIGEAKFRKIKKYIYIE